MKEGWHNDDYLILFEGSEIEEKEKDYEIDRLLPGHRLVGMVGFDEPLFRRSRDARCSLVPVLSLRRSEVPGTVLPAACMSWLQLKPFTRTRTSSASGVIGQVRSYARAANRDESDPPQLPIARSASEEARLILVEQRIHSGLSSRGFI